MCAFNFTPVLFFSRLRVQLHDKFEYIFYKYCWYRVIGICSIYHFIVAVLA